MTLALYFVSITQILIASSEWQPSQGVAFTTTRYFRHSGGSRHTKTSKKLDHVGRQQKCKQFDDNSQALNPFRDY